MCSPIVGFLSIGKAADILMNPRLLVTTMKSGKEYILCLATPAPPQRNFPQWFVGNVVWSPVANYSWTQALCTNLLHNGRYRA